jgi:Tol biopolymer transport system component
MIGHKIGAYEVVAKLGEGGMGEVYRARDARLHRDVALKVLPETFAADPERLARLTREAQTLASLNHANVAHVYGLEQTGATSAIAMELVDGPTLDELIKTTVNGLPVSEALTIALQITAALEAAHDRGIVHRDLKPANVKVQPDGVVKVLDFGLAKAIDPMAMSGGSLSNSPTLTGRMTQLGMILGTAAYMAPEQARGRAVDRRADIWAFGCVLFEMLTARRPFDGSDIADVLAKILERDPDWSALPASTPAPVRRLIGRCLAKDPKQRLRDIGEARIVIDEVIAGRSEPEPARALAITGTPPVRRRLLVPWTIAALATVAALAAWAWPRVAPAGDAPVIRVTIDLPPDVEVFSTPLISANGRTIAFVGVRQGLRHVYYRRLSEPDVRAIRGTETAGPALAISPDGNAVAFVSSDGRLNRVNLDDGSVPQAIATKAGYVFGLAWINDEIVFTSDQQLMRVSSAGGEARPLTPIDTAGGETRQDFPFGLGTTPLVAFRSVRQESSDGIHVDLVATDTGRRQRLGDAYTQVRWLSASDLVFSRGDTLFVAPFHPDKGISDAAGTPFLSDVGSVIGGLIGASVSDNGAIVYVPATARRSTLVWVAPDGTETALPLGARDYQNPRVSPDGRLLAFVAADGLWVIDLARGSTNKPGPVTSSYPIWMPDSRRLVVKDLAGRLLVLNADATGSPITIPASGPSDFPVSMTPDGKAVAVVRLNPATSGDVYMVPMGDGQAKELIATPAFDGAPQISADGKWLVYSSDESGRMEVYLRMFDDASRRWTISTMGGLHPVWSRDGRRVYYRSSQQLMSADVVLEPEVKLSTPRLVFDRRYEFGPNISQPNFSLHPDNTRLLMVKPDPGAQSLQLILNWRGLIKR